MTSAIVLTIQCLTSIANNQTCAKNDASKGGRFEAIANGYSNLYSKFVYQFSSVLSAYDQSQKDVNRC